MFTSLLTTLAALLLAGASVTAEPLPVAPMPRLAKTTSIYKLKYAASDYAAQALNTHFQCVVAYSDAPSNSLLVNAEPGLQQKISKIVADLDKASPQFVIRMTIIKAKAGFAEETGIAEKKDGSPENHWVLSPREVRMFGGSIRQAKIYGGIDILSRPMLQVGENQTGFVQVGDGSNGIATRVTPRVLPDGKVLLRIELTGTTGNACAVAVAGFVEDGGTLIVRGPTSKSTKGESSEMLYVLTVHVVK